MCRAVRRGIPCAGRPPGVYRRDRMCLRQIAPGCAGRKTPCRRVRSIAGCGCVFGLGRERAGSYEGRAGSYKGFPGRTGGVPGERTGGAGSACRQPLRSVVRRHSGTPTAGASPASGCFRRLRERMASEEGRVCRAAALEHCGPCRRAVRDFCLRSFEDVSEENRMRRAGSGPPGHHAEKTRFGGGSMPAGCVCFTFEEP